MDERERMREVLAAAMGWMFYTDNGGGRWLEPPDRAEIPFCDWDPFTSWEQAGLVIKEMRAKRWGFQIHCGIDRPARAMFWHLDNLNRNYCGTGEICYAVSLAAYRALEAADE